MNAARSSNEALVIANMGSRIRLRDSAGDLRWAPSRRDLPGLVAGDRVTWEPADDDQVRVLERLPRRTILARPGPSGSSRPMAANVDGIWVVIAPRPPVQDQLVTQYLVVAAHLGIPSALLLNKVDLLDPKALQQMRDRLAVYGAIGYEVLTCSTKSGAGIPALTARLAGKTSVFVGQSGVGKSSLIRDLSPDRDQVAVGELGRAGKAGRHTTSRTTLYDLIGGGAVIDSPGVRQFGLWHLDRQDVAPAFVDFRPYLGACRFRDCTHGVEPDCAVRGAMETGAVHAERYAMYRRLMDSWASG